MCIQDVRLTQRDMQSVSAASKALETVHPRRYNFVVRLLAIAVIKNLQTYTRVTQASSAWEGEGICLLSVPRGTIKAKKLIYASFRFTAGMLPHY